MARKPKDTYIACTVFPGMLGNEFGVEIEVHGTTLSLFADQQYVKVMGTGTVPGIGLLRVWIEDAGANLIALPAETLEQGRRFLQYPIDQLRSA